MYPQFCIHKCTHSYTFERSQIQTSQTVCVSSRDSSHVMVPYVTISHMTQNGTDQVYQISIKASSKSFLRYSKINLKALSSHIYLNRNKQSERLTAYFVTNTMRSNGCRCQISFISIHEKILIICVSTLPPILVSVCV